MAHLEVRQQQVDRLDKILGIESWSFWKAERLHRQGHILYAGLALGASLKAAESTAVMLRFPPEQML
ncbi:hypothetical protein [Halomonas halocynthiae]|uniref:hypothetical protein n=1 Tax=Halomonas halocynthiae TaxID=176290 RepID=UPI00041876CA|nr:hypothetical protein [Halomonas halocynthiae]